MAVSVAHCGAQVGQGCHQHLLLQAGIVTHLTQLTQQLSDSGLHLPRLQHSQAR